MSIAEASRRLKLCERTVYDMVRKGEIPGAYKLRKYWRIPADSIERLLNPPLA